jgi:glutamine amidotransferase
LCDFSEENNTGCLGVFSARVRKFPQEAKVPHIGWNTITNLNSPLFREVKEGALVYFVHSYYAQVTAHTTAETYYICPFSSAMQKNNFYAVQFHPEKSGKVGDRILRNFIEL